MVSAFTVPSFKIYFLTASTPIVTVKSFKLSASTTMLKPVYLDPEDALRRNTSHYVSQNFKAKRDLVLVNFDAYYWLYCHYLSVTEHTFRQLIHYFYRICGIGVIFYRCHVVRRNDSRDLQSLSHILDDSLFLKSNYYSANIVCLF